MPFSEPLTFVILVVAGAVAGFLNVMAGGGSALTIPLMIFMGYDATVANGSNRIAIQVEALTAVATFKRNNHADFPLSLKLGLMTLPGGILGAFYAVKIDDALFTKILAGVMALIIVSLMFPRSEIVEHARHHKWAKWLAWPVMTLVGFYGGFPERDRTVFSSAVRYGPGAFRAFVPVDTLGAVQYPPRPQHPLAAHR